MDPIWALFVDFDEPPYGGIPKNTTIKPEDSVPTLPRSLWALLQRLNRVLRDIISGQSRSKNYELHG
jgi:hypothetical protein